MNCTLKTELLAFPPPQTQSHMLLLVDFSRLIKEEHKYIMLALFA